MSSVLVEVKKCTRCGKVRFQHEFYNKQARCIPCCKEVSRKADSNKVDTSKSALDNILAVQFLKTPRFIQE